MRFGVREICDVVLRAKNDMKIGNMKFEKDAPVFYFDSLKTSSLESAATTVYAQGGKGNSRLIAWDGEKTVTFTMEDALISPVSLSMLSGAEVIETGTASTRGDSLYQEDATITATTADSEGKRTITISGLIARPYIDEDKKVGIKVFVSTASTGGILDFDTATGVQNLVLTNATVTGNNPYTLSGTSTTTVSFDAEDTYIINYARGTTGSTVYTHATETIELKRIDNVNDKVTASGIITQQPVLSGINYNVTTGIGNARDASSAAIYSAYLIPLDANGDIKGEPIRIKDAREIALSLAEDGIRYQAKFFDNEASKGLAEYLKEVGSTGLFLIDYYYAATGTVTVMNITPDKFAGSYYLEGSTLFRTKSGKDLPAEFIVPNCKIQSNFTFTMASSGDPSTFTFTMDAFPDYPKHSPTTKVLAAIQLLEDSSTSSNSVDNSVVSLF